MLAIIVGKSNSLLLAPTCWMYNDMLYYDCDIQEVGGDNWHVCTLTFALIGMTPQEAITGHHLWPCISPSPPGYSTPWSMALLVPTRHRGIHEPNLVMTTLLGNPPAKQWTHNQSYQIRSQKIPSGSSDTLGHNDIIMQLYMYTIIMSTVHKSCWEGGHHTAQL